MFSDTVFFKVMKLLSIVGARPQFVKIAPFARAIERRKARGENDLDHFLVHTGQHYDAAMSDVFFAELDLPEAHFNLGVGSGLHGSQTGLMLAGIEQVLLEVEPDVVVVYGDTNSTLAGALASAKLHIPVAHVEAGLRSFRREMPEEINRIVADHVCDLLLAPTPTAMKNLVVEGLGARAALTGDIMVDAVLHYRKLAGERSSIGARLGIELGNYGLVTVHRAENTDDLGRLRCLLTAFNQIAANGLPLVFPVHPRTRQRIRSELVDWTPDVRLKIVEPVGYLDMLWLLDHAFVTLTDSGGLQKEAFFLGCPCVTLRDETEWVETVELGGNILAGTDAARIRAALDRWQTLGRNGHAELSQAASEAFGQGEASTKILDALVRLGGSGVEPNSATGHGSSESTYTTKHH